jgi:opacity protein-like surface antigen
MKKMMTFALGMIMASSAFADGQVFYRYGGNHLSSARGGEIFTDTLGTSGKNNDTSGMTIGAGLDLKLMNCPLFPSNSLVGEIYADYSRFSNKTVVNAINYDLDASVVKKKVTVSELSVVIAPKYRFDGLGKVRPWIVPVGLAFLVNNPPSNTTSYLDVGFQSGAGVEYMLLDKLSLGVDYRYTQGSGDPELKMKYSTYAGYVGINF